MRQDTGQDIQPTQQGGRMTRAAPECAEASKLKGTATAQGARTGSQAVGDWTEDLVESLRG